MKVIAIIPARYASTRFPGKPLADIGGVTMIERVYGRVAQHYQYLCVATDDERIAEAVRRFDGQVVMTSTEHRSGTDRCAEALEKIEAQLGVRFDVVVNVQGDEPFVAGEHLAKICEPFADVDVQITTLVKPFVAGEDIFNPNTPKVVFSAQGRALYFSRSVIPYRRGSEPDRWSSEGTYYKHIGIYGYRADVLRELTKLPIGTLESAESLEQLRWLENGYTIAVTQTTAETIAVDTPEDLERVNRELLNN